MASTYRTGALSHLSVDDLRHHLNGRSSRALANNTTVESDPDGTIAVRLHATRVLTFNADGSFTVNTGGWHTTTTKQRLNALMPAGYRIYSVHYAWRISTPEGEFDFADGDTWKVTA